MKMKKLSYIRYVASLFAICVLAGCTDDLELPNPTPDVPQELEEYYFVLDNPVMSRSVEYTDDNHSEFTGGELLGCFALDENDNQVPNTKINACYAVSVISSENKAVNGKKVLVPNNPADKLDKGYKKYLFYYPYNKDIKSLDELKKLTHSVKPDQSKHEDYEASDLLWDVAVPTDRFCRVEMDHAMANIIIVIDGVEYDVEKGAVVLGQPLTATDINLTAPTIENMWDTEGGYYYSVDASQTKDDIQAMYADYSQANDRFRAAVPANRTLKEGDQIIKLWSATTGKEKIFRLKTDMLLEAGKNYYFTLIKKGTPDPADKDDESWVLDVLDPETGEPVGLLCREYLRYQDINDYKNPVRETPTTPADNTGEPRLNSQAWVFYNLQADGKTPELSVGTVMRFIYDVRVNLAGNAGEPDDKPVSDNGKVVRSGYAWPAPHHNYSDWGNGGYGVYLAKHGYHWSADANGQGIPDNPDAFIGAYYMHGGTVVWDGGENLINRFIMPDKAKSATNEVADLYAHIAIPEDGEPRVSFTSFEEGNMRDADGSKIGFVFPHTLIDRRVSKNGKTETNRYPLVKIGFNQFWMSKSLRAQTLTDGTPLHCFNSAKCEFSISMNNPPNPPEGFVVPFCNINNVRYDPYFDTEDSRYSSPGEYMEAELEVPLLYNCNAFEDYLLKPKNGESISEYVLPNVIDYGYFGRYLGFASVTKMMTNLIIPVDGQGVQSMQESEFIQAFVEGYSLAHPGCYSPNVSGLNLKPFGAITQGSKYKRQGSAAGFWIESDDYNNKGFVAPLYNWYNSWGDKVLDPKSQTNEVGSIYQAPRNDWKQNWDPTLQANVPWSENYNQACGTFLQVRYLLKYKNQKTGPGSRSMDMPIPSCQAREKSRNVYVAVE